MLWLLTDDDDPHAETKRSGRCRQSLTVLALGWVELGISALTLLATCLWVEANRRKQRNIVDDSRRLV